MKNILIIDDRNDFIEEFISNAAIKGIGVSHGRSFEALKEKMPKLHHKISVVILDIKCLISESQEVEDESFIGTAITYLDQHFAGFPRIVLTGDDESFIGYSTYHQDEEVFLKTDEDIKKLFERIEYYCDNSEDLRIKRENKEVFDIFKDSLMDGTQEVQVLNLLKSIQETRSSKFKGIVSDIRSVQEMIYKKINEKNKSVVPNNKFKPNGMIKFNELMKHLNGNPDINFNPTQTVYQNSTIYNFANSLYWSCGEYIHEETNRSYMISNNAIRSLVYNLLELLIWSKKYLK